MSILDYDEVNRKLDDYMERISPKLQQFKEFFFGKVLSVVMICSDKDSSLKEFYDIEKPKDKRVVYFDLSKVEDGEYKLIFNRIYQFTPDGVLFDNIDKIPTISEKEKFEYMVQMALKRDTLPYGTGVIDFADLMVGAKCKEYPEYLNGKSLLQIIINMPF